MPDSKDAPSKTAAQAASDLKVEKSKEERKVAPFSTQQDESEAYVRQHRLDHELDTILNDLLSDKPDKPKTALALSLFERAVAAPSPANAEFVIGVGQGESGTRARLKELWERESSRPAGVMGKKLETVGKKK